MYAGTSAKISSAAAAATVAAAADSLKLASSTMISSSSSMPGPTAAATATTSSAHSPCGPAPSSAAAALHVLEVGGQLLPVENLGQLAETLLSLSSCRELLPGVAEVAMHLCLAKPEPPVRTALEAAGLGA